MCKDTPNLPNADDVPHGSTIIPFPSHRTRPPARRELVGEQQQGPSPSLVPLQSADQRLLEMVASGILVLDERGTIVYANAAASRILGVDHDQLVGQPGLVAQPTIIQPDGSSFPVKAYPPMVSLLTGQAVHNVLMGISQTPRPTRWLLVSSVPDHDPGSNVVRNVVVTFNDVTGTDQAPRGRALLPASLMSDSLWLQTIIEHLPCGIIFVDVAQYGRVVANRRAEELLGHEVNLERVLEDVARRRIVQSDGTPFTTDDLAQIRALRGQVVVGQEQVVIQPGGKRVTLLVNAAPIRDDTNQVTGGVVIMVDISVLKEIERLRNDWIDLMIHDLRHPAAIILRYTEALAQLIANNSNPDERRIVEHLFTTAGTLDKLTSDLRDLSALTPRNIRLDKRETDLGAFVHSVVDRAEKLTPGRPIDVIVDNPSPTLTLDPIRIEQVLNNLLTNAATYSVPGSEIRVWAKTRRREAEISVTSRGKGIPSHELAKVFQRFYRGANQRGSVADGLGVGLYICKGLVEAHGGRIWVDSTLGEITTFSFTLPLPPSRLSTRPS